MASATFKSSGRKATQPPHRGYPDGLVVDTSGGEGTSCAVDLAYPAQCIGTWEVRCATCGVSLALTAAGRKDDPRRVVIRCGVAPDAMNVTRRPWDADDETNPTGAASN